MTNEELATWVREHPDTPEASALKAWAEDREIFHDLKWGSTPEAERWRKIMEGVLASVAPSKPPGALWRGAAGPDAPGWLAAIRKDGGALVASPGDSFSLVRDISEKGYLDAGGFLMRLDEIDGAIDMAPVFAVTGGKGSRESEWVLPGGTRLALVGESVETVDISGQKADVPVVLNGKSPTMNDLEKDIRKLRERRGGNGGYYDRVFETPAPGAKFPRPQRSGPCRDGLHPREISGRETPGSRPRGRGVMSGVRIRRYPYAAFVQILTPPLRPTGGTPLFCELHQPLTPVHATFLTRNLTFLGLGRILHFPQPLQSLHCLARDHPVVDARNCARNKNPPHTERPS